MKLLLLLSFLLLITNYTFCQSHSSEKNEQDSLIYLKSSLLKKQEAQLIRLVDIKNYNNKIRKFDKQLAQDSVHEGEIQHIMDLLIDKCDLNKADNDSVEMYLAEFEDPYSVQYLFYYLKRVYFEPDGKNKLYKLPQIIKEQNLSMLANRIDIMDNNRYMYYENYNSKPNFLKGFEMYHENDYFMPGINQDRELTGGFKFTIITDYFKWRWFRMKNENDDNMLSYQTISLIGTGYTPYIRYQNSYDLADSLFKNDRPFASFFCIERAKHRTWKKGLVRHKGELQVGSMGISQGRKIQARLHEDVIIGSQFVHGWENQIADGGRLVYQLNHKFDFLLYSNTNQYKTIFNSNPSQVEAPKRKYGGRNIIVETEAKLGTIMTTLGGGIRFSTLDFLKQSGNQMILSKKNSKNEFGWKFDVGLNYRYVFHNSMLEGMGLFETYSKDIYDVDPIDKYVLSKDQIERNMFVLDWGISLKWRKTTVFFRQNYHTLEYHSGLANVDFQDEGLTSLIEPDDVEHYYDKVIPDQNKFLDHKVFGKQIYGFGTLGISWIIE